MAACVAGGWKTVAQVALNKRINPKASALRHVLGLDLFCKNQEAEENFDGTESETQQTFARPWILPFSSKSESTSR